MKEFFEVGPIVALYFAAAIAIGRIWVKKFIEKAVDAQFDKRLEKVRSDLRVKEGQITALQSSALAHRAGRDAIIEKRRIEVFENLWKTVVGLREYSITIVLYNWIYMDCDENIRGDAESIQRMVEYVGNVDAERLKRLAEMTAETDRLFVPVDAWASFLALKMIMLYMFSSMFLIKMKISLVNELVNGDHVLKIAREALPSHIEHIDNYGLKGIGQLVTPLEELLLSQLQKSIHGQDADEQAVERAAKVIGLVNVAESNFSRVSVENSSELRGI